MDTGTTTTIEELRSRLGDLEARQRAAGGVADAAWAVWSDPDAEPDTEPDAEPDAEHVDLRLSVGLDAAAQVVGAWQAPLSFCREGDLIDMIGALGRLQQEREVLLVRVVAELQAREVDSPGGLSRVDWLRAVDPSMTAAAAKAVVTVATTAVGVQDPSPFEDGSEVDHAGLVGPGEPQATRPSPGVDKPAPGGCDGRGGAAVARAS